MQIIFDKAGKRMNDYRILEVTEKHVEDKAVFEVDEKNAMADSKAKKAHMFKEAKKPEKFESDTAKKPTVKAKK